MPRPTWFSKHPPMCTCVQCTERRVRRIPAESRRPFGGKRSPYGPPSKRVVAGGNRSPNVQVVAGGSRALKKRRSRKTVIVIALFIIIGSGILYVLNSDDERLEFLKNMSQSELGRLDGMVRDAVEEVPSTRQIRSNVAEFIATDDLRLPPLETPTAPASIAGSSSIATPTPKLTRTPQATPTPFSAIGILPTDVVKTITPTSVPTSTKTAVVPSPVSASTLKAEPTAIKAYLGYHEYLLGLINDERVKRGLLAVELGDNAAAQAHAEDMIEHGYLAHWGRDGLKPYMRYRLAGGLQYESENVSGPTYRTDTGFYASETVQEALDEAMEGLMDSPGHRKNILDPWHKKVNLGIGYNGVTASVVQQFEGDYIIWKEEPSLVNGIVEIEGEMTEDFKLTSIDIWYDRLPVSSPISNLNASYCYDSGSPVLFFRPPPGPREFYLTDVGTIEYPYCTPPRDLQGVDDFLTSTSRRTAEFMWKDANVWDVRNGQFHVAGDIFGAIQLNGPGVYTVVIWGDNGQDEIVLSQIPFWVENNG